MNISSNEIVIAALYKFVRLPDFRELRQPLLERCRELRLKGTLLLAPEGINGTVAGSREGIDGILDYLRSEPRFAGLAHKESLAAGVPFHRMKVKLKQEIVSLGIAGVDPEHLTGEYVKPEDWNAEISRPGTLVLDVRNEYETGIGGFKNAVAPDTGTFREFPDYVEKNLDPEQHTRIAMYCTGGIRCEKASSYLLSRGFREVVQLQGGILNYLEKVDRNQSRWEGECFVFDSRVAVDHELAEGEFEQCYACRRPLNQDDMASEKYLPGVSCPRCHDDLTPEQRRRFSERQRQVELAESRGEQHIGTA
ncbi:MAG: rhodanese-related sulfurtransferase [Gammaproteobacteria bacterium]|nr:rhodanese-related sulfurtransferase [Gammaproteobacteria bacterium]